MPTLPRSPSTVVAAGGLAALAVAASLFAATAWLGFTLAALTMLLTWGRNGPRELALDQAPRALAVAALVVAAATASDPSPVLALAGAAVIALIASEGVIARVIGAVRLETVNLPVERGPLLRWFESRTVCRLVAGLTAATAPAAAAQATWGVAWASWLLAALVAATLAALAAGAAAALLARRASAHSGDEAVRRAVRAHAPEFLVHLAGPPESDFHLLMWLEYFDRLRDRYLIVLRNHRLLPRLAKATGTPIVVAPNIADVEGLVPDTARAVFYVNNSMENAQLVRTGRLTHVQLMHGDSDKLASRNPVSAMYDLVFVAGQAGVDRYRRHGVDIPDRKFRIVGRPQLHAISVGPRTGGEDKPVVLYTPTWAGTSDEVDYSSLAIGRAIVEALLDNGATVILRAHPFTKHNPTAAARLAELERLLADDAQRTRRPHRWGAAASTEMTLAECVNAADAAVTDVSGAASDWLYSGRPFALTDMHGAGPDLAESLPLARGAYIIGPDGSGAAAAIEAMLGPDPLADERAATRAYYLGDIPPERCVDAFLEAARAVYRPSPESG